MMQRCWKWFQLLLVLIMVAARPAGGQGADAPPESFDCVVSECVPLLLEMQEGDGTAEWPYEGVYREGGEIPIGYRVGGTAIVASSLLYAPGWEDDAKRQHAIARATKFITSASTHPQMQYEDIRARYDVRGWGYAYGLHYLLQLRALQRVPDDQHENVDTAIRFFIAGIEATKIPQVGGWNYSRGKGFDAPSPPACFMTAPTLLALFDASAQGFDVDTDVVELSLKSLERGRTPTGSFQYSGSDGKTSREPVPGAVGRMLVSEIALQRADRSSADRLRAALDAFIEHWKWLDQRRAKHGTHVRPYGVAPYYFYFAHYYAAMAVELLPLHERAKYRQRVRELLIGVRRDDGTWNDRVFERSANYGTAMTMMALQMPDIALPSKWNPIPEKPE